MKPSSTALHDLAVQLLVQGIHPDMSAAQMQLAHREGATARSCRRSRSRCCGPASSRSGTSWIRWPQGSPKHCCQSRTPSPRQASSFSRAMIRKRFYGLALQARIKPSRSAITNFLKVWPEARQRIPYVLMQEMRITPELPIYDEVVAEDLPGADRWQTDHPGGDARLPRAVFAARAAAAGHHQALARQTCRSQNQGAAAIGGRRVRGCIARMRIWIRWAATMKSWISASCPRALLRADDEDLDSRRRGRSWTADEAPPSAKKARWQKGTEACTAPANLRRRRKPAAAASSGPAAKAAPAAKPPAPRRQSSHRQSRRLQRLNPLPPRCRVKEVRDAPAKAAKPACQTCRPDQGRPPLSRKSRRSKAGEEGRSGQSRCAKVQAEAPPNRQKGCAKPSKPAGKKSAAKKPKKR